jgi:hypothetical protein
MAVLTYYIFFILSLFTAGNLLFAAEHADFLLIENAEPLKIYDHYQQELTNELKKSLISSAPLQIIAPNELLGDQLTHAFHIKSGGRNDFFIINDKNGKILNREKAGELKIFRNCKIIGDSIYIKKSGIIKLNTRLGSVILPTGAKLIRFFKYRNRYYALQTSPLEQYGWIRLSVRSAWDKLEATPENGSTAGKIPLSRMREMILTIFHKENRLYQKYFDYFNRRTLKNLQPPQWEIEFDTERITAFFPDSLLSQFRQSVDYAKRQVENVLMGSAYTVTMRRNQMFIGRTEKNEE